VLARHGFGLQAEDDLHLLEPVADESAAGNLSAGTASSGAGVGEVDEAVFGKARVQSYIEQSSLAARHDLRHPGNRLWLELAGPDNPQSPRPLGHQHPAVGEEGESPGVFEPGNDLDHAEGVLLGPDGLWPGLPVDQGERQDDGEDGTTDSDGQTTSFHRPGTSLRLILLSVTASRLLAWKSGQVQTTTRSKVFPRLTLYRGWGERWKEGHCCDD
jgi:hypothetical protein